MANCLSWSYLAMFKVGTCIYFGGFLFVVNLPLLLLTSLIYLRWMKEFTILRISSSYMATMNQPFSYCMNQSELGLGKST